MDEERKGCPPVPVDQAPGAVEEFREPRERGGLADCLDESGGRGKETEEEEEEGSLIP